MNFRAQQQRLRCDLKPRHLCARGLFPIPTNSLSLFISREYNEPHIKSAPRRVAYFIALLSIIFLVAPVGAVFASGITWTNQTTGTSASGLNWQSITSSSDGTKLAAAIFNGDIWTSTTTGATWTNQTTGTSTSGLNWFSITSSSVGDKLAAAIFNGDIWTSTDSGATWTNQTTGTSASGLFWSSITFSSDGIKRSTASFGPTN